MQDANIVKSLECKMRRGNVKPSEDFIRAWAAFMIGCAGFHATCLVEAPHLVITTSDTIDDLRALRLGSGQRGLWCGSAGQNRRQADY